MAVLSRPMVGAGFPAALNWSVSASPKCHITADVCHHDSGSLAGIAAASFARCQGCVGGTLGSKPADSELPLMTRMLSYAPAAMAAAESAPPYVTPKFLTMLLCPAAYHTSPNTTSKRLTEDALPAQPEAHAAVMLNVMAPCASAVG